MAWRFFSPTIVTNLVTALPSSPIDGQIIIFTDSLSAPTYQWQLQYVAAKTTNKWVFIGGSAIVAAERSATPTTTSASYVAPSTNVSVTVPVTGSYEVVCWGGGTSGSASTRYLTPKFGSAAADDADGISSNQNTYMGTYNTLTKSLTASDAIIFHFKISAGATFTLRHPYGISIRPIAVGGA